MKKSFHVKVGGVASSIGGGLTLIAVLSLVLFVVIGWVMNILKIFGIAADGVPADQQIEILIRISGVVIVPVGAILGVFW